MVIKDETEKAEYSVTLRIISKTTDVETITRSLKIKPDKFSVKGSPVETATGKSCFQLLPNMQTVSGNLF